MTRRFPLVLTRSAAMLTLAVPAAAFLAPQTALADVSFGLSIRIGYAPPPMPVYEQPPLPGPDYIWIPGRWEWSDWIDDYFWVDGYWERPPEPGLLWTPAWWGWDHGAYIYHGGYWGREVGWYGGIDFGYGYHGHGWEGGYWNGGHLAYNRAAVNVTNVTNINVTNVYYRPVTVVNHNGPRVSYAGGQGGVQAQPTPAELRATQAPHIPPTPQQQQRVQQAAATPASHATNLAPAWHPPAVHRVGEDGAPIPRTVALTRGGATAGAPPAYQHPAATPGQPVGQTPRPGYAQPMGQGGQPMGQTPRPGYAQPMGQGAQPMGQTPRPGYAQPMGQGAQPMGQTPRPTPPAPPPGYTPPHPQPMGQPAYGQAPHPAPQVIPQAMPHMTPPPRPAPPPHPAAAAPHPAPQQQQHPHDHDHT